MLCGEVKESVMDFDGLNEMPRMPDNEKIY